MLDGTTWNYIFGYFDKKKCKCIEAKFIYALIQKATIKLIQTNPFVDHTPKSGRSHFGITRYK